MFFASFVASLVASLVATSDAHVHHLRPSPRVILGTSIDASRVPFFCSLHVNFPDDSGTSVCGCALISSTVGATAAHCLVKEGMSFADARVRPYGSAFWTDGVRLSASGVAVHPEYDVGGFLANDVAVFRLPEPLAVDVVPTLNRDRATWDALTSWDRLAVVGVGATSNEDPRPLSLGTPLHAYQSRRDCANPENYFGEALLGWHADVSLGDICAGPYSPCDSEGRCADSCNGDSGGPLFAETRDGNVTLYGLVSRGTATCGARGVDGGAPGIYTPTDEHWMFMTTVGETLDPRPPSPSSSPSSSPSYLRWRDRSGAERTSFDLEGFEGVARVAWWVATTVATCFFFS